MEITKDQKRVLSFTTDSLVSKEVDGNGIIEGYAATFDNIDLGGDVIRKGAFAKSIRERVKAGRVKLMSRHFADGGGTEDTIGTIIEAKEDDVGLYFKAIVASTPKAQEVRTLVKEKHVEYSSIGYIPVEWGFIEVNGQEVVELKELKLFEVTITPKPMNELARLTRAKSLQAIETFLSGKTQEEKKVSLLDIFGSEDRIFAFCKEAAAVLSTVTNDAGPDNSGTTLKADGSDQSKADIMRSARVKMLAMRASIINQS